MIIELIDWILKDQFNFLFFIFLNSIEVFCCHQTFKNGWQWWNLTWILHVILILSIVIECNLDQKLDWLYRQDNGEGKKTTFTLSNMILNCNNLVAQKCGQLWEVGSMHPCKVIDIGYPMHNDLHHNFGNYVGFHVSTFD
jgi:hypothetical protein